MRPSLMTSAPRSITLRLSMVSSRAFVNATLPFPTGRGSDSLIALSAVFFVVVS